MKSIEVYKWYNTSSTTPIYTDKLYTISRRDEPCSKAKYHLIEQTRIKVKIVL